MSKILISLLGTGRSAKGDLDKNEYEETDYKIGGTVYPHEKFVSAALIKHYGIDRLYLVGTSASMWDSVADTLVGDEELALELLEKKEAKRLEESDLESLNVKIDRHLNSNGSRCLIVQDGESEDELWSVFDRLLQLLDAMHPEDEVYIDITHLFRSLSVMTFILAQMGRVSKGIRVEGIFYAMFKKEEPSAIVDLTMFFELLEWSRAIHDLKAYGNSWSLNALIAESDTGKELKNAFSGFSNALSVSNMGALQSSVKVLKGKMEHFEKTDHRIIRLVSEELRRFIDRFNIASLARFQYELAKWYAETRNYAMAYLTLAEAVVSAICEAHGYQPDLRDDREKAKDILYEMGDWKTRGKDDLEIAETYRKVNAARNNIAHKLSSADTKHKATPAQSIENLENYLKKLAPLFD